MAKKSSQFLREFISEERRNYKIQIGSTIASSLAGVVCGAIIASIIWYAALKYFLNVV